MFKTFKTRKSICLSLLTVGTLAVPGLMGQGFTSIKHLSPQVVGLRQWLPALVNLSQKSIRIEALSLVKPEETKEVVPILQAKLKAMMQKDPRYTIDEVHPQTLVRFTIANYFIEKHDYTVSNGNGGTQNCSGFTGTLDITYQALDAATSKALDSDNLIAHVGAQPVAETKSNRIFPGIPQHNTQGTQCGGSMSSPNDVNEALVNDIAQQMVRRTNPTQRTIPVRLPYGQLEVLSRYALGERWGTLLEEAQKTPKLLKPQDDAYRVYLIGVAKEGMAYDLTRDAIQKQTGQRKDVDGEQAFKKALSLIDESRAAYKEALDANSREADFSQCYNRTEAAITVYAEIQRHQKEFEAMNGGGGPPNPPPPPPPPPPVGPVKPPDPVTPAPTEKPPLSQILVYCQKHLGMDVVSDYIKDASFLNDAKASGYKFDVKNDPVTISEACGSDAQAIMKLMKARLNPPSRPAAPAAKTPAPVAKPQPPQK